MFSVCSLFLALISYSSTEPATNDWPKFLGPNGTGAATIPEMDLEWGSEGPKIAWTCDVGPGFGGAAIRDGEVYLLDRIASEKDVMRVFDLESGEELWSFSYDAPGRLSFAGSRTVPTVTDQYVYTCGGFGHVYCFDRKSHKVAWKVDLEKEFGGVIPMFGWSASPIVFENKVIVTPLGDTCGLLALDTETGKEVWRTPDIGFSHSTPAVLNLHGEPQLLFISSRGRVSGESSAAPSIIWSLLLEDGSVRWQHELSFCRLPIPPPILIDDETIFLTGGYSAGSVLLYVDFDGESYDAQELARIARGSQTHPPIFFEDHAYVIVNENTNDRRGSQSEGGLLCLDMNGEEMWRTGDSPYFGRGSSLLINDQLVIQDGLNGVLRIVNPTPEGYELVREADIFKVSGRSDKQMWAPLSASRGFLIMRSQEEMKCLDLRSSDD